MLKQLSRKESKLIIKLIKKIKLNCKFRVSWIKKFKIENEMFKKYNIWRLLDLKFDLRFIKLEWYIKNRKLRFSIINTNALIIILILRIIIHRLKKRTRYWTLKKFRN